METNLRSSLSQICNSNPDAVIIGSIGRIAKELSTIEHPNKILIKGAMGAAVSCGLGYALNTDKQVIVIVGEGSFLMRLGSMATVMAHNPQNLRIIIMNNGRYESCGGQKNHFDAIKSLVPFEIYEDICEQE